MCLALDCVDVARRDARRLLPAARGLSHCRRDQRGHARFLRRDCLVAPRSRRADSSALKKRAAGGVVLCACVPARRDPSGRRRGRTCCKSTSESTAKSRPNRAPTCICACCALMRTCLCARCCSPARKHARSKRPAKISRASCRCVAPPEDLKAFDNLLVGAALSAAPGGALPAHRHRPQGVAARSHLTIFDPMA